jgi:hypothetical protein
MMTFSTDGSEQAIAVGQADATSNVRRSFNGERMLARTITGDHCALTLRDSLPNQYGRSFRYTQMPSAKFANAFQADRSGSRPLLDSATLAGEIVA